MKAFLDTLFVIFQHLLPQHLLSRLVGYLARSETAWLKNTFINIFMDRFGITLQEAEIQSPEDFKNFNAFFTRALQPDARPIDAAERSIVSPADGAISQCGPLRNDLVLQAKGRHYTLKALLGSEQLAEEFKNGSFATVYLSPKDYHRVHMPATGTLREMIYVPGRLFSVNQATAEGVNNLFARNERAVCVFDSEHGPFVVVLVGAMIVAGIETVFAGQVTPLPRHIQRTVYPQEKITLKKGDELGRFMLGSTAIVVFPEGRAGFIEGLGEGDALKMGEKIGDFL